VGILDGQPVSAAVTNPAFLDANADDTALGKITLNNISDPVVSGPSIINIQREFNALSSYTGKPTNVAINTTPTWINNDVGGATDTLFERADALTAKFNFLSGHMHTGGAGDAPLLTGASIGPRPYRGYFIGGIDLTGASGGSTDVSTELTGKTPSTNDVTLGVVVNTPYNRVILRQASGPDENDPFTDGSGNEVYGRVTESVGVWTLTYYVDLAGVETAYSFGSPVDIRWYYQEIFDPLAVGTPVYDQYAFIPSENATADVIDATSAIAGKVLLSNAAPPAVAGASALGAQTRVAREDHTHADNAVVEYHDITAPEALAKSFALSSTPFDPTKVVVDALGGGAQRYGVDYTVTGSTLSWTGLGLDGVLDTGDALRILYWT